MKPGYLISIYLKKRKLLIGQEAVLELDKFTLEGREKKSLRNALNSLQKKGYTAIVCVAPLQKELVKELKHVSDEWLNIMKGKRSFFHKGSLMKKKLVNRMSSSFVMKLDQLKAFLNIIPDFAPGECTMILFVKRLMPRVVAWMH